VDDRNATRPASARSPSTADPGARGEAGDTEPGGVAVLPSLSELPVAGITRRHVAFAAAAVVSAWLLVMFARQVSDATSAGNRVDALRVQNVELAAEVDALESELALIGRPEYINQQAAAYRLGPKNAIPFRLDPSVPKPAADAPGSATVRIGAATAATSPVDSWLSVLFGPTD
jgi:hypothetical protein